MLAQNWAVEQLVREPSQEIGMARMNFTDARGRLHGLAKRVEAGETIEIVRRGKAVMRLVPIETVRSEERVEAVGDSG